MKIIGSIAEMNRRERRIYGCGREEYVASLDCDRVLGEIALREENLAARPPATPYDYIGLAAGLISVCRDRAVAVRVAGMVMVHELEEHFNIPHDAAVRREGM